MSDDTRILELSLTKLSLAFDHFISECMEDGKPRQPTMQALMRARGYLPPYCVHAYKKKGEE